MSLAAKKHATLFLGITAFESSDITGGLYVTSCHSYIIVMCKDY